MWKRVALCGLFLMLLWAGPATTVRAAAATVERVTVELVFPPDAQPAPPLAQRMDKSLSVISEQLLQTRPVSLIAGQRTDYERVIREVAERVLTGYEVDRVTLSAGTETGVRVLVRPWGPTVTRAEVKLMLSGISVEMLPLVRADLGPLEADVQTLLLGLSQDAVDWSGGAVKQEIRRLVEVRLPEFQATVDVSSDGAVPTVSIVLLPIGQTIQGVQYQMTSMSIPNILMVNDKEVLAQAAQCLRGLPVQYAKRRETALTKWLTQQAMATQAVGQYRLTPKVSFQPATDAVVQIQLESDRYRVWIEGRAELNSTKDNLSGKLHAGKFFSPKDELFIEVSWLPADMDWTLAPGYARHAGTWSVGAQVATSDNDICWWLEEKVANNWRVRTQFQSEDNAYEFSLRYRIHEFLSVEYVVEKHDQFVRLVGNL